MQRVILIGIAGLLAGCAAHAPLHEGGPPEHGRGQLFVSPMGEPFRTLLKPGAAQALWFDGADADHDGRITLAEFQRDASRFFAVLDRGKDGEIDPGDLEYYENVLVPEIRVAGARGSARGGRPSRGEGGRDGGGGRGGRGGSGSGGGGQGMQFGNGGDDKATSGKQTQERLGAARYGFFDLPEPVISADRNGNRGVDAAEFATTAATRFEALDRNHDGALTRGELPRAGAETWRNGSDHPSDMRPGPPPGGEPGERGDR